MKSFEEMTQSVLNRAKEQRSAQKRRNRNIIVAAAACICSLTLAIVVGIKFYSPTPTDQTSDTSIAPNAIPKITLLTAAINTDSPQELVQDIVMPFNMKLRVRDIRGLTKQEADQVRFEERTSGAASETLVPADGIVIQYGTNTAVITLIYNGKFYLILDDYAQVQDMSVTTTSAGTATLTHGHYKADDETVHRATLIKWMLSNATVDKITENPTMKLSEIRDTLTVTIKLKDGNTATVDLELTVDDDGKVYITQRGITVTA